MNYALAQIQTAFEVTTLNDVLPFLLLFIPIIWLVGKKFAASDQSKTFWWSIFTGIVVGVGIAYCQFLWDIIGRGQEDYRQSPELAFFALGYFFIYIFYAISAGNIAYFTMRSSRLAVQLVFPLISILAILIVAISPVVPYLCEETWRSDARIAFECASKSDFDGANRNLDKLLEELKAYGGWQPKGILFSSSVSDLEGTLAKILEFYQQQKRTKDINNILDRLLALRKASETKVSPREDLFLRWAGASYEATENPDKAIACYQIMVKRHDDGVSRDYTAAYANQCINDCLIKAGQYADVEAKLLAGSAATKELQGRELNAYVERCIRENRRQHALDFVQRIAEKFYRGQTGSDDQEDRRQAHVEDCLMDSAKSVFESKDREYQPHYDYQDSTFLCRLITSKYKTIYPKYDRALEEAVKLTLKCAVEESSLRPGAQSLLQTLLKNPQLIKQSWVLNKYSKMSKGFDTDTRKPGPEADSWD